jgi:hypothetical protein
MQQIGWTHPAMQDAIVSASQRAFSAQNGPNQNMCIASHLRLHPAMHALIDVARKREA